jgi:hypothetical protein
MYEIETRRHEPKNFFAGDYPTLSETGIAGATLEECMPVVKADDGKIVPVTAPEDGKTIDVIGIAAAAAEADEPAVYYMTGEFFAEALVLPDGVEIEALKDAFRKISIFLK